MTEQKLSAKFDIFTDCCTWMWLIRQNRCTANLYTLQMSNHVFLTDEQPRTPLPCRVKQNTYDLCYEIYLYLIL